MTILEVPDMHCQGCVARITAALNAAEIDFKVSLDTHRVMVPEECTDAAIEALDDIGFDAEAVDM